MSEKMDGIRAYWDGSNLLSRHGKKISTPIWFVEELPSVPLDGEMWMGRGKFEKLLSVLKTKDSNWDEVGYYLFDLPESSDPYEERMNQLDELKQILPTHVHIVAIRKCQGREHLEEYLESIIEKGGEGIMARQPLSLYVKGLTSTLIKVKADFFTILINFLSLLKIAK